MITVTVITFTEINESLKILKLFKISVFITNTFRVNIINKKRFENKYNFQF